MSKKIYIAGSSASFANSYSNSLDGITEYAAGSVAADIQFTGSDTFTISAWVNKASNSVRDTLISIGRAVGNAAAEGIYIYNTPTSITFVQGVVGKALEIRVDTVLTVGDYFHILWVKPDNNANNSVIYIDDVAQTKVIVANTLLAADLPTYEELLIGRRARSSNTDYFDGLVYNLGVFDAAADATQAAAIYAAVGGDLRNVAGIGGNCKAAFHFPGGQADYPNWTDYAGGNDLTMHNQESTDINTDIP